MTDFIGVSQFMNTTHDTAFSMEVLPPLRGKSIDSVFRTIERLLPFNPAYVNITTHRTETIYHQSQEPIAGGDTAHCCQPLHRLHIYRRSAAAAGGKRQAQGANQRRRKFPFHIRFPPISIVVSPIIRFSHVGINHLMFKVYLRNGEVFLCFWRGSEITRRRSVKKPSPEGKVIRHFAH